MRHVDVGKGIPIFAPKRDAEPADPLDLDPAWLAERAAKRTPEPTRRSRGPLAGIIVALLVIAIVVTGVFVFATHEEKPQVRSIEGPGISIRITAVGAH